MTKLWTVIALVAALAGCSRQAEETAKKKQAEAAAQAARAAAPVTVKTASAGERLVERSIDVTGSLQPDETVSVSAEIQGRVAAVHFDFGQSVRKGEVLVELDRQEPLIQLERSKAAISQLLARMGLGANEEDVVPKSTPAIRQARAQWEDAKSKYDSAERLTRSGDIARERFTEAEKALAARQAALDAAQDDLKTNLANLEALRAERKLLDKRLRDTTVRAPFDGQVSAKLVAPGQYVKDNVPLMTIVKAWPLRLRVDVPEVAAASVKLGDTLTFTAEAVPGVAFPAVVSQLNPSLEQRSRSLAAEARLPKFDARLRPGMFVEVKLTVSRSVAVVTVPKQALYTVAGLTKLFVIRNSKAHEIRLAPGISGDGWVEVPGGVVKPGDVVAVDQTNVLTEGAAVREN